MCNDNASQRWNDLVEGDNYILCLNESAVIDILKQPEPPTGDSSPVGLQKSQLGQKLDVHNDVDQTEPLEKSGRVFVFISLVLA